MDEDEETIDDEDLDDEDGKPSDRIDIIGSGRRRVRGCGVDETASDSVAIEKVTCGQAIRRRPLACIKRPRSSSTLSEVGNTPKMAKLSESKC